MKIVTITDKMASNGQTANGVKVSRAMSALGHSVSRITHSQISRDALRGADLVLSFGTVVRANAQLKKRSITSRGAALQGGYFKQISQLKDKSAISALWYFDQCNPKQSHSQYKFPAVRDATRHLDWLITTDHSYPWERVAKRYLWLMQGVDPADFAYTVLPPEPRAYDVIYTGGCDGFFAYRKKIIQDLKTRFKMSLYGRNMGRKVFGRDFFAVYQRARVGLVPHPLPEARDHYWSNRIYLATATGTPCVVGYVPGIEEHFTEGKEVLFYHSAQDVIQQVHALMTDPARRRDMGQAARARTLAEHTYEARCRTMIEAIERGTAH